MISSLPIFDDFSESKISDLDMSFMTNEQVLWLEISIRNVHTMEVFERKDDLNRIEECHIVRKSPLASKKGEHFSTTRVIQKHEDVTIVLESAVAKSVKDILTV